MRIVFDTNVLARAHQKAQGPARRVRLDVSSGSHVLITSPYILAELERVLTYPRLLKKSGLTTNDVAEYLESLALVSFLVTPAAVPANLVRDSTDSAIVGTALAGKADVLCTRDEDFFEKSVREFCEANGIQLLTDLQLLEALRLR